METRAGKGFEGGLPASFVMGARTALFFNKKDKDMTIKVHDDWLLSEKGRKDAARHREKIDESIRKNIQDVISEESIITKKQGKMVRVPVRGLKDYRFVYGSGSGPQGGVGQGEGKPGDIIARRRKKGDAEDRRAGNQPGEDYMETEVDIDYLINIMFEDLGLPYIEEKTKAETLVPVGWKFESISKKGIQPRIHKNKTLKETIKRTALLAAEVMDTTGCTVDDAYIALAQAQGVFDTAVEIIERDELDRSISPDDVFIEDDDLRYKQIEEDMILHSNAVIIAMMDTSGSMDTEKKYLARSFLFWLTEFLKKTYNNVQNKFIVHTTDAYVVDEETFFKKGESGGTMCASAFDLAGYIIDTEFPVNMWNVYVVYISDGEDWDASKTIESIKEVLARKINMLGYCEINLDDPAIWARPQGEGGMNTLLDFIRKEWTFTTSTEEGTNFFKNDEEHFLACSIQNKRHVYPALKHLLFEKRKA
jgi:hypothetical protein